MNEKILLNSDIWHSKASVLVQCAEMLKKRIRNERWECAVKTIVDKESTILVRILVPRREAKADSTKQQKNTA